MYFLKKFDWLFLDLKHVVPLLVIILKMEIKKTLSIKAISEG